MCRTNPIESNLPASFCIANLFCGFTGAKPTTDSRFTDDDAVQQIRILCTQLLNLQDRAAVREVASATIATLLENCSSSHTSTMRPPPNSPPHSAAAKPSDTASSDDKATCTACDAEADGGQAAAASSQQQCHCRRLTACAAMQQPHSADRGDAGCAKGGVAASNGGGGGGVAHNNGGSMLRQRLPAARTMLEAYPQQCGIRCMCSEGSFEETSHDAADAATEAGGIQPIARSRSTDAVHSNIIVYAQLGNSATTLRTSTPTPTPTATTSGSMMQQQQHHSTLEVDEELARNSIVLDDNDYHANDCTLPDHEVVGGDADEDSCPRGHASRGGKLVLDLSDRTKYTKEVSV